MQGRVRTSDHGRRPSLIQRLAGSLNPLQPLSLVHPAPVLSASSLFLDLVELVRVREPLCFPGTSFPQSLTCPAPFGTYSFFCPHGSSSLSSTCISGLHPRASSFPGTIHPRSLLATKGDLIIRGPFALPESPFRYLSATRTVSSPFFPLRQMA